MENERVFDMPTYRLFDQARISFLREVLPDFQRKLGLRTALDVGCGLGNFSGLLTELGFATQALDGRAENVEEATRRYPEVTFHLADIEDPTLQRVGSFDLVLCLGLLYHLENPFRAIRNIQRLVSRLLVVESMCIGAKWPLLYLRDEGPGEDQGLRQIAFYPSEGCLVKMLYRSGFSFVYRFSRFPRHVQFSSTPSTRRIRTFLAASFAPIELPFLTPVSEPKGFIDPWATRWGKAQQVFSRVRGFVLKPWAEKVATMRRHLGGSFSEG